MRILGESATVWDLDFGWDVMVHRFVLVARSRGVPTIDGTNYFAELTRPEGNWHSHKTDAYHAIYVRMFEEAINLAYAVTPHGAYGQPTTTRELQTGSPPPHEVL